MKRMHLLIAAVVSTAALIVGCGGGAPSVDSPADDATDVGADDMGDGMPSDDMGADDMPSDDMGADDMAPSSGGDGIIRDADGDGQPDDQNVGCDGLSKTKCQITSGCAWSGDDKCVEATGGGM